MTVRNTWIRSPDGTVEAEPMAQLVSARIAAGPGGTVPLDRPTSTPIGPALPVGGAANTMLHPYSIVEGIFPHNLVRITGLQKIGGREGLVIEVGPNPADLSAWAPKWGDHQIYVVDTRTGILLSATQYTAKGTVAHQDRLSNVVIDDPGFSADFSLHPESR